LKSRYKVLFLASWYPNKYNDIEGIFIKNHAHAISKYTNVIVLYIRSIEQKGNLDSDKYEISISLEDEIKTIRIYFKKSNGKFKNIFNSFRYFKAIHLGLKTIKAEFGDPDIVHLNVAAIPMGIIALFYKYAKNKKYVLTEHWTGYTELDGNFKKQSKLRQFLIRKIIKNACCVTTVSSSLKNAMQKLGMKNKYFIIPNVIEGENVRLKEPNSKKRIVSCSTLSKQKNIFDIIKAVNVILEDRNDFELHIIGDGDEKEKLEQLSDDLGLRNKVVFFHGLMPNSEVLKFMANSDFLVLNSNFETFSVVTAEALACGIPVIATKSGGPEEFVNSDVGILIEPKNQEQLIIAIKYMLDNHMKYDPTKLHEYAMKRFNNEIIGKNFLDVYAQFFN